MNPSTLLPAFAVAAVLALVCAAVARREARKPVR